MKISGLGVFDFSEEDELPDVAAGKFLKKFKDPNSEDVAILKYKFLERVALGTSVERDIARNTLCVDEDAVDCDKKIDNGISSFPLCTTQDDFAKSAENPSLNAATQSSSTSRGQQEIKLDNQGSQSPFAKPEARVSSLQSSPPRKCLINAHLDSPLRVEPVDICADADESVDESSTSSLSDIAEDGVSLNGWASDHCFGDLEMYQRNMAVTLQPDYVMYRDTYCTESLVTFSQSYIRAVGHDNKETFNIEWGADEIVDIKCQRFHEVDIISVKLHVVSKDDVQTDNAHGTAGVEELKFAVVEPNWAEKRARITCLNDKYLAIGDVLVDEVMDGDDLPGSYFPSFDEPFEEVVYPKGDVDAVSISKRDVVLLQPETFINDTIIDFYIKYLENQLQSEERTRFHFFNSFFFRKLADLDKDPSSASDGRAAFLRVRKWTRKVDLFKKDYIFIPVNFNLHWSLIVICHLGEVASFKDEDLDQLHKVPCILHMDSIKGSHSGLKNLVQSYLWEEWKERQMEISEQISSKFLNLRFVELELPQQENSFDCGLFLLHYLELFLGEAHVRFSPFQINKFSAFLNVDWFPPVEASLKRALIQKLIFELLENRSREISSPACSDEHLSYKFPENKGKETCVEFISERCNAGVSGHQNLLGGLEGEGVEISLLAASSVRGSQCVYNSGPVLRDLLESGAAEGSSFGQYQSYRGSSFCHQNGGLLPLEEDGETGEDFILLASEKTGFGQGCSISQASKGLKAGTARDPAISVLATHEDVVSSPETSDWESDDDIGIIEQFPTGEGTVPSQEEEKDKQNCLLVENIGDAMDSLSPSRVIEKTSAIEGSKDLNNQDNDRGHLHAKDSTFIHMVETTAECSTEPSRDLNNVHVNDGDQVLPKDPASEIANTPTDEGCQLDKFLLKDGQYLPSEDPACSGMVKISTDTIFTNKGDGDPHAPSSLLSSDLVGSELEHEHTMSENGNVLGDDMAESRRQHSVKRRYVPEGQGEQAVKKMRSASFVNKGVVDG